MANSLLLGHHAAANASYGSSGSAYFRNHSLNFNKMSLANYDDNDKGKPKRSAVRVRCEAAGTENEGGEQGANAARPGRRELIQAAATIAAAGLYTNQTTNAAKANPIVPPDLTKCGLASVNTPQGLPSAPTMYVNCCLLKPKKPAVDYTLPPPLPRFRKLRRPAHLVDSDYIAKYEKAYQLMKNLPEDDPRNFMRQADIHCAFCNGAYDQLGYTNNKLQVHFSWLFFPWHRWYLYFHERILAHLIGDPHFSLVYWNWDNQYNVGGNMMPKMFTKTTSPLYDAKRNPNHLPPILNELNVTQLTNNSLTNDQITQDNLNIMYQSVVTASTPDLFMGKKYSAGDPEPTIGGTLEMAPHTSIHAWVGDSTETYLEDMGNFYSAARDPIFFSHHSNVDRLWSVWNKLGGRRRDHTDPDFLEAEFVFYDEHARMVKVKVKDALDSSRLGVFYAPSNSDALWINYNPQSVSPTKTPSTDNIQRIGPASQNVTSVTIDKKLTSLVARPTSIPQDLIDRGYEDNDVEEVLVLQDVQVPRNVLTNMAVFINLPDADESTPISSAEYVGSFIHVPHLAGEGMDAHARTVTIRFGISDNIKRIGIKTLSDLIVTIVVKAGTGGDVPITLKGVIVEYE